MPWWLVMWARRAIIVSTPYCGYGIVGCAGPVVDDGKSQTVRLCPSVRFCCPRGKRTKKCDQTNSHDSPPARLSQSRHLCHIIKSIIANQRRHCIAMFTTNTSIMDSLCLHGGDTCDAGNPFDINSTSINSTLLLLCSYPARVAMLILSASFIIFANLVIKHNQDLRKKINSQQWFLIQMLMHPVIVGGTVYMANITGNEWWGLLGLPFIFTLELNLWILQSYHLECFWSFSSLHTYTTPDHCLHAWVVLVSRTIHNLLLLIVYCTHMLGACILWAHLTTWRYWESKNSSGSTWFRLCFLRHSGGAHCGRAWKKLHSQLFSHYLLDRFFNTAGVGVSTSTFDTAVDIL